MKRDLSKLTVAVIGAGIGGLAAASLFASRGCSVVIFEKNGTPGGKMQEFVKDGYRFDTGPSLFTMPFILENLFEHCGEILSDYITYSEPEPLCRYIYRDGVIFDNDQDRSKTEKEILKFAPKDAGAYSSFLDHSGELYRKTADAFLLNPLYELSDLKKLNLLDALSIDAFSTVSDKVDSSFSSSYLRKFFKRFTTYNGSSPFQAPATLNVIPHVELNQGGYYVNGGLYRIAESLEKLALKQGVQIQYNTGVSSINVENRAISSLLLENGERFEADITVSNADATDTLLNLLPDGAISDRKKRKQSQLEPSCSGFVLMLGCSKKWDLLRHHNIFFSENYEREFDQIFSEKVLPDDPTIYIANTSFSDPGHAPKDGCNLFILINSPYVTDQQQWDEEAPAYRDKVIKMLEKAGLDGLKESIEVEEMITPKDFLNRYGSNRGSIYGTSSNSTFSAFLRPRNRLKSLKNLYLVGGSTHPGGGIPLVVQSAFNAVELFERDR